MMIDIHDDIKLSNAQIACAPRRIFRMVPM